MKRLRNYLIVVLMLVTLAFANTSGPNFPTAATGNTNAIGGGATAWTNPQNIEANDGTSASALPGSGTSDDLIGTGYGFSIPAGATINGIQFELNIGEGAAGTVGELNHIVLLKAGAAAGTDKGSATRVVTNTATTFSFGGASDLWGTTWAPADINASNFGSAMVITGAGSALGTVAVDFFRITVTFTPSTGCKSCMFHVLAKTQSQTRSFGVWRGV